MSALTKFLSIMRQPFEQSDIDAKLVAFENLKTEVTDADLAELLVAINSNSIDFWTRELLSEPIAELGGAEVLEPLLTAYELNIAAGHDNDMFGHFLREIIHFDPTGSKKALLSVSQSHDGPIRDHAKTLLSFCDAP